MARPPAGSLNKRTREIAGALNRLERDGKIDPEKRILGLDGLATDTAQDPHVRIAAIRLLLAYRFGQPRVALDVATTHELGESTVSLLLRLQSDERHRQIRETVERERRRLTAVTVEAASPERENPALERGAVGEPTSAIPFKA